MDENAADTVAMDAKEEETIAETELQNLTPQIGFERIFKTEAAR